MEKAMTSLRAHTTPGDGKPKRQSSANAQLPSASTMNNLGSNQSPAGSRSGKGSRRTELKSQPSAGSIRIPATPASQVKLQNTYRMSPSENTKFNVEKIEKIVKETLDAYLYKVKYDPDRCAHLANNLVSVIKSRVKEMGMERYRLIVQVMLGQDSDQGIQQASRCLWNPDTDNFAAATYRNNSLYALGVVYGLYLD